MLDTLRQCPEQGSFTLSSELRKDLAWVDRLLPTTDGMFLIYHNRHPVHLYLDACMSGCGALTVGRAYHTTFFTSRVLWDNPFICHLEALNAALAIKLWAPQFVHQLIHLFCDNQAAVTIFQAGQGKDAFLQACSRDMADVHAVGHHPCNGPPPGNC